MERGSDFFEKYNEKIQTRDEEVAEKDEQDQESEEKNDLMTTDELYQLRVDTLPQV